MKRLFLKRSFPLQSTIGCPIKDDRVPENTRTRPEAVATRADPKLENFSREQINYPNYYPKPEIMVYGKLDPTRYPNTQTRHDPKPKKSLPDTSPSVPTSFRSNIP